MSQMSQENAKKNNLRFKTKLQMSHCIPRLRHTHVEANSSWWLMRNISADRRHPGRKGHGWRNLAVCGARVGSNISESLGDKHERA